MHVKSMLSSSYKLYTAIITKADIKHKKMYMYMHTYNKH